MTRLRAYAERVTPLLNELVPRGQPDAHLYALIRQHLARPGKGLRPALCIATAQAFGADERTALPTAAALELLHNALLVHDDIEDGSEFRRDQPTMHAAQGVPIAVNAGDGMIALAFTLLLKNRDLLSPGMNWRVLEEFNHLTLRSIEGQAMELGWVRDNDLSVRAPDYLLMILKKTCWYSFIHPCRLGALLAGQHDLDRFNRFGFLMGAAFQIQDDILNLVGDEKKYGKEIGGDLWEGKRTLMLMHALSRVTRAEHERFQQILALERGQRTQEDVAWMAERVRATGSIEYAIERGRELAAAAQQSFSKAFEAARPGPHKAFIEEFVGYMVEREL